jgi:nucleotide-binding universal stress UspA family protein
MYERILICTDGSALSCKAVTSGIVLAAALDVDIVAYTVITKQPHWNHETVMPMSMTEAEKFENARDLAAQNIMDAVLEEARHRDVKTITSIGHGDVAANIIAAAKKHRCDLIVMASHGRKGVQRLLLGSETLDVLTHSHIPVLVLR